MPRWPEQSGLEVRRLDDFAVDDGAGPASDDAARTFTLRFDAAPAVDGETVALAFDGIATVFAVVLNGTEILRGTSMFAAHEVDVGTLLRAEGNVLEIRCGALTDLLADQPKRPRQRWRTKVVENGGALRFVRTAILGRAPGFAGGPPIVGPWRPVWLVRRWGIVVDDVVLRPRLEGADGVLSIAARIRAAILPAQVEAFVGPTHTALQVDDDGHLRGEVRIPGVEHWWPHTHGEPSLYDVALVLDGGAGRVDLGHTGFRALSPGPGFDADRDALALVLNDVPVFARGAVWTPVAEDEVRSTLRTLRDAGLNLVRIPGIGVPETPEFHDACDELGLLVWQDFTFANLDYPIEDDTFRATVEDEARALLRGIAGRPSLAVLCGNSEVEQQAAMFGAAAGDDGHVGRGELFGVLLPALAREAGAGVPYLPSAPCGGALPFHPGTGVANYFGVGGYRRPLSDARTAGVRFASECLAFANLPDGPVADGEGVMRDVGSDWDFADVRDHYLRERYGLDPDALRAEDRERYLALGRQVTGEMMTSVFGEWRRAASPCTGGIVLWARDLRTGAGWGLLAHDGAPKVALAHLRRALAPVAVWIVDEGLNGLDVHVANDGATPLEAELHVALLAGGEHTIAEAATPVWLRSHGAACFSLEGVLGRFADAACAYRFGPPAHDTAVATLRTAAGELLAQAAHFPAGPPLDPTEIALRATASPQAGGVVAVELQTDRVAWGVRIAAPGFRPDDDAFTLVPGTPRTISLHPTADTSFAGATVTALNLTSEMSV